MPVKSIATYDFSTLYTKLAHEKLVDELSSIIDSVFEDDNKSYNRISRNWKAFWEEKIKSRVGFSKSALQTVVTCIYKISSYVLMKKDTHIFNFFQQV